MFPLTPNYELEDARAHFIENLTREFKQHGHLENVEARTHIKYLIYVCYHNGLSKFRIYSNARDNADATHTRCGVFANVERRSTITLPP